MADMQELYDTRLKRVADAVQLKEPDRIPIVPVFQAFPVYFANQHGIPTTIRDLMYEYRKGTEVYDCLYDHYQPDMGWDPILFYPTDYMERSGLVWFKWAGKHIKEDNMMYQFIEDEYMKANEYGEAIHDITKFMMNKWIPRSFNNLSGLAKVDFRNTMWFGHMGSFAAFSDPEIVKSFETLAETGKMLLDWFIYLGEYQAHMKEKYGMPPLYAGFAYAPFDMIGDTMRGTKEILMDMYERPDELLALIDVVTKFAIKDTIAGCQGKATPYVWFWLHKGIDEFMSDEYFKKFYWPSLRQYLTEVAEAGLTPMVYVEGAYNTRLEYLKEVPVGKVIYNFEYTNMEKAKKVLGGHSCIMGNVPTVPLMYGKKEETVDYCKWLIDTCGPGGGFIMDTACMIDYAKPENIEAMFETTFTYGKR
jgi:uroporphyrinogen-III decarboxylase